MRADTNFDNKEVSVDILRAIDTAIDKRLKAVSDFSFDEIKVAKFSDNDKSVFITELEVFGGKYTNKLYLSKEYFEGKTLDDLNVFCKSYYDSGWWKSKNLEDLVNHEIMHARINSYNSLEKIERLYDELRDDIRIEGFCRFVDANPDEFLNEMYVAINNGENIDEKYLKVYTEYINEFLGGR